MALVSRAGPLAAFAWQGRLPGVVRGAGVRWDMYESENMRK